MHHTTKTDQSCHLTSQWVLSAWRWRQYQSTVTFISIDEPIKILLTHFWHVYHNRVQKRLFEPIAWAVKKYHVTLESYMIQVHEKSTSWQCSLALQEYTPFQTPQSWLSWAVTSKTTNMEKTISHLNKSSKKIQAMVKHKLSHNEIENKIKSKIINKIK